MLSTLKNIFSKNFSGYVESIALEDTFISLSFNKDEFENTTRNRVVKIAGKRPASFSIGLEQDIIASVENGKRQSLSREDVKAYNSFIDKCFFHIVEESKKLASPQSSMISLVDNESKGLEWLRVSLKVLTGAFEEIQKDENLLYQGRIFFGKKDHHLLRIQSLSLDILLEFLDDHRLRLRVWNYKDGQKTSLDDEDLFTEFVVMKGPVLDEIINLLSKLRPLVML